MDIRGTPTSIAKQTKATVMEKASWKLLDKRWFIEEVPRAVITARLTENNRFQQPYAKVNRDFWQIKLFST